MVRPSGPISFGSFLEIWSERTPYCNKNVKLIKTDALKGNKKAHAFMKEQKGKLINIVKIADSF